MSRIIREALTLRSADTHKPTKFKQLQPEDRISIASLKQQNYGILRTEGQKSLGHSDLTIGSDWFQAVFISHCQAWSIIVGKISVLRLLTQLLTS